MAIVNRDLDLSQQNQCLSSVISTSVGASAGAEFHVAQMPFPGTLKKVVFAANSVSGSAQVAVDLKRWTATGLTTIAYLSTTLVLTATGISSAYSTQSVTINASLGLLQAGDVICVNQLFSGGNVGAANMVVSCVVQATQDICEHFGITQS